MSLSVRNEGRLSQVPEVDSALNRAYDGAHVDNSGRRVRPFLDDRIDISQRIGEEVPMGLYV